MTQGNGGVVGINYSVAQEGLVKYKNLRSKMEQLISQMRTLQKSHPEEWTGEDENMLAHILADANKKLGVMDENIHSLSVFVSTSSVNHKSNEKRNSGSIADAYFNLKA